MEIENQLFAPALKGVIDFGYAEHPRQVWFGSSHPLGLGPTKNRGPAKRGPSQNH